MRFMHQTHAFFLSVTLSIVSKNFNMENATFDKNIGLDKTRRELFIIILIF